MDNRELKEAGNALIQWFNSQEINQLDALMILSKVAAKIIAKNAPATRKGLEQAVDTFTLTLVHDVNAHTFSDKWGKS